MDIDDESNDNSEILKLERKLIEDQKIITLGVELLKPLKTDCLTLNRGWWMYEVCVGKSIRQYHVAGPEEAAKNNVEFYLGKSKSSATWKLNDIVDDGKQFKSLSIIYGDGTACDLTGKPRQSEVEFRCWNFNIDQITATNEAATCEYKIQIHTPKLCKNSNFVAATLVQSQLEILCDPIIEKTDHLSTTKLIDEADLLFGEEKSGENSKKGVKAVIEDGTTDFTPKNRQTDPLVYPLTGNFGKDDASVGEQITGTQALVNDAIQKLFDNTETQPKVKFLKKDKDGKLVDAFTGENYDINDLGLNSATDDLYKKIKALKKQIGNDGSDGDVAEFELELKEILASSDEPFTKIAKASDYSKNQIESILSGLKDEEKKAANDFVKTFLDGKIEVDEYKELSQQVASLISGLNDEEKAIINDLLKEINTGKVDVNEFMDNRKQSNDDENTENNSQQQSKDQPKKVRNKPQRRQEL